MGDDEHWMIDTYVPMFCETLEIAERVRNMIHVHIPKSGGTAFSRIVMRAACPSLHLDLIVKRLYHGSGARTPILFQLLRDWTEQSFSQGHTHIPGCTFARFG